MSYGYKEVSIDTHNPNNDPIDELLDILTNITQELNQRLTLEEKQEYALKKLDKILDWNMEHGYLETLFPVFQEFITCVPEEKLNEFLKELEKYSTLRVV